ncbi:MAG: CBS domain-containing protein [Phycisphaerae bacterium]|nr:CBS domain-containing protein [Phycisphaerae bacterium]
MAEIAELRSATNDLTVEAMKAFAEDISTMFDTEVESQQSDIESGTITNLKNRYKKLCAVIMVRSEGIMDGEYQVIIDREGLFTLAGTFVMQPEQIIHINRKSGGEKEAADIGDALGEVGNLLVGAFDRVFRENYPGHGHHVQSGTFVGNPWSSSESKIRVAPEAELDIISFAVKVGSYEPFYMAVTFPASIYDKQAQVAAAPPEAASAPADAQSAAPVSSPVPAASANPAVSADGSPPPAPPQPEPVTAAPVAPSGSPSPSGPVSDAIQKMAAAMALSSQSGGVGGGLASCSLTAQQVMRSDVVWVTDEETVEDIINKMQRHDSGYILVGKNGKLDGIISRSDVRGALSPYLQTIFSKWRTPMDIATLQIKARWVMNRPVRTIRPDASVGAVMHVMMEHGGRCMPVVDENGRVLGIVTVFDIFHALLNLGGQTTSAGRIAEPAPLV